MSDLRDYGLAVERDVVPPDLAELVRVAERRRRARNLTAASATVAAAVAIGALAGWGGWPGTSRSAPPAHSSSTPPSDPSAEGRAPFWTVEDVVGHPASRPETGRAEDPVYRATSVPAGDAAGEVTRWWRCEAGLDHRSPEACEEPIPVVARTAWAVTRSGAEPLIMLMPPTPESSKAWPPIAELARYVGDGRFYLALDPPVLAAAGASEPTPLTLLGGSVPPRRGQLAVPCRVRSESTLCVLDPDERVLTQVDLPTGVTWSPSTVNGYWGVRGADLVWQGDDGSFRSTRLLSEGGTSLAVPYDVPPGLLAVYEWEDSVFKWEGAQNLLLHVSSDGGDTWRTLDSPRGGWDFGHELADGWESWPEAEAD